jgi:hypothetical protein
MTDEAFGPTATFFLRHWRGHARLWSAYWIIGILGRIAVLAVWFLCDWITIKGTLLTPIGDAALILGLDLLTVSWFVFAMVCIWRCAPNVRWQTWGVLARLLVIISSISFVAVMYHTAAEVGSARP